MDEDGNEPAPTDSQGNLILNFGTSIQGQAKKIRLYAKNTINFNMQLEPLVDKNEPDLKITRYPPIIKAGAIEPIDITFTPDIDRISPLNSSFDFRKIILAQ